MTADIRSAVLVGSIVILPLVILQAANVTLTRQNTPGLIVLFSLLWIIAVVFLAIGNALWRNARGGRAFAHPARTLVGATVMLLLVLTWTSIVADQFPCFLGVPNCD